MNWAGLFERASDHETSIERILTTLAGVRTERETQERDAPEHDGRERDE